MTSSLNGSQRLSKLAPGLSVAALTTIFMFSYPAQAELIINNSIDDGGQVQMVISEASQDGLPPAQLGIQPSVVDEMVSLTQRKNLAKLNQSFTLYNYGTKPKVIKLSLIDVDEAGKPIEPSESTLKPWTLINPTQFTIAPGGYQTVRMSIRLPTGFVEGKRHSILSIEQQIDHAVTYNTDGRGATLEIGSRYGLPITIDVQ
ncbi:hypothetical protein ACT3N8_09245 [Psychrobacter aquimaris]|uniref:hypothetical protein n=1 Tax=Psychrobacter aquimaris TaxID=292733 RepID=UPI003FD5A2B9